MPLNSTGQQVPILYFVFVVLTAAVFDAAADEYHYNSILIGDRAAGLAGAYIAVSDDPSGLYYNPAGIVHASTDNFSGSMNAIHTSETVYENALGSNTDWVRSSSELLPSFFGVLQDFHNGKAGFSYTVVDSTLENQDQDFTNLSGINKYTINFNNQDKTIYFGPSYATSLRNDLSIGVTLYGHYRSRERILHEYIDYTGAGVNFGETTEYTSTSEVGIRPVIGLMYSPLKRVSLGVTLAKTTLFSSSTRIQNTATYSSDPQTGTLSSARNDSDVDQKRSFPLTVGVGAAVFVNSALLIAGDLNFQEAYEDRVSVLNFSLGSEYYLSPTWAIRGGIFSNLANTPKLVTSNAAPGSVQLESIDYFGFAVSAARFSKNNTLSMGLNMSFGGGDAQLFVTDATGTPKIQSVSSSIMTVFLAATYSY